MRKKIAYFAFLLPFVALAFWVYGLSHTASFGESVVLKVAAYDPRDLLSGHYLQYSLDFSPDSSAATDTSSAAGDSSGRTANFRPCSIESSSSERCVCLKPGAALEPAQVLWMGACAEELLENCKHYLRGSCENSRFETGLERYYFPDEYSTLLRHAPAGSKILVRLDGTGSGVVTDFFVKDQPLLKYLKK